MPNTDEQPLAVQVGIRAFRKWKISVLVLAVSLLGSLLWNLLSAQWEEHDQIQKELMARVIQLEKASAAWAALADQEQRLRELEVLTLAHDRIGKVLLQLGITKAMEGGDPNNKAVPPRILAPPNKAAPVDPNRFREQYQRPPIKKRGK